MGGNAEYHSIDATKNDTAGETNGGKSDNSLRADQFGRSLFQIGRTIAQWDSWKNTVTCVKIANGDI